MMSTPMGEEGQAQLDACGWGGGRINSMWMSTEKLEPTDVNLSSSHAKKFLVQEFCLWMK